MGCCGCPVRACIGIQIFFACFMVYVLRVTISINLLAMVTTAKTSKNVTVSECVAEQQSQSATATPPPDYGTRYDWDRTQQGFVLGAYFYGYLVTCAPGGQLADKFGATRLTLVSIVFGGVVTMLIPLGAMVNVWVVIVLRFLVGAGSGAVYPALHSLIAKWAPPQEKGKFVAALMGNTLGTVVTWPLLGAIIESVGWTWAFVVPGAVTVAWAVLWFFTVADTPNDHRWIAEEEKNYINDALGGAARKIKGAPPYKKIFLNVPFWASVVLHFGNLWGLLLLLNNGPMYMKEALGFNITSSGALAALPYLARLFFGLAFGGIGDVIRKKELLSVTFVRKFFTIFSHILPGALLFMVTLAGCNWVFAVVVIVLSLGFNGASTLTNLANCQDLSPNFAGTIYGLLNFMGTTTGFITPSITSYITREKSGIAEWSVVFCIGGTVYIGSAVVFLLFGSGQKQEFNEVAEET